MANTVVVVPFPPTPPATPSAVSYELEMQRTNTAAYIATDPTDITFTRRLAADDGEGGRVYTDNGAVAAQRVRVVTGLSGGASTGAERRTVDGEVVIPEIMLVCEWDAVVQEGWRFLFDGDSYEVVFINDDSRYEKLVEVAKRG